MLCSAFFIIDPKSFASQFVSTYTAICGTESVTLNHFLTNSQSGIFKAAPCLPIMMYCETI